MKFITMEMIRALYLRFTVIFGHKFTHNQPTSQLVELWWDNWHDGLLGVDPTYIKEALNHCRLNLDWPPSLAEFRTFCERASGFPTVNECLQAAIRQDFHHPFIELVYSKIGNWEMSHATQKDLEKKFKSVYKQELSNYRLNKQKEYKLIGNDSHGSDNTGNDCVGSGDLQETARDIFRQLSVG